MKDAAIGLVAVISAPAWLPAMLLFMFLRSIGSMIRFEYEERKNNDA